MRSSPNRGIGWLVLAGVSWGAAGTVGTVLGRTSQAPFHTRAFVRLAVGGALLLLILAATGRLRLPRSRAGWLRVAVIGLTSAAYQLCYFTAVGLAGVSVATLVTIGSTPLLVLLVEGVTGRVRAPPPPGGVGVLALAGLSLLVGRPVAGDARSALLGSVCALGSGAAFAVISLVGAHPVPDLDAPTATGFAFLFGAVLLVPFLNGLRVGGGFPSYALIVLLGLVPTALAYTAYFHGLQWQPATIGSLVALLEPVTGTTLAAVFLRERIGLLGLVGALLLLGSVVASIRGRAGFASSTA